MKIRKSALKKSGAFLTLGITFLSVIVLGLATLLLRQAETSEDRLREMVVFDRVYNIDSSLGDIVKQGIFRTALFNFTMNETFLMVRHHTPNLPGGALGDRPFTYDYTFFFKNSLKQYLESANSYLTVPASVYLLPPPPPAQASLDLFFDQVDTNYFYTFLQVGQLGCTVCLPQSLFGSFAHVFIFPRGKYKDFYVKFTTTNATAYGALDWYTQPFFIGTYTPASATSDEKNKGTLTVMFQGPNNYVRSLTRSIKIGPDSTDPGFPVSQVVYVTNISNASARPVMGMGYTYYNNMEGDFFAAGPFFSNLTVEMGLVLRNATKYGMVNLIHSNISIPELAVEKYGPIRII